MSPGEKTSFFQLQYALRRVYGKQCGLGSRRWRDKKVADFITVMRQERLGDQMQWSFRKVRYVLQRLIHQKVGELPGDRLHCFHQDEMNREAKRGVLSSETPIRLI